MATGEDIQALLALANEAEENSISTTELNALAFGIIAQGSRVHISSSQLFELDDSSEVPVFIPHIGQQAIQGYFRGFQKLVFDEEDMGCITQQTVRVDGADNSINLIPSNSIDSFEDTEVNPVDILDDNDLVLAEIDELLLDKPIDIDGVRKLFEGLDIEDMKTIYYLSYVNKLLSLREIVSGLIATTYILPDNDTYRLIEPEVAELVTPDDGKSFCLIQVVDEQDKYRSLLCACVISPQDEYAIVPVEYIRDYLYV